MRSLNFSDIAPGRTRKDFKLFVEKKVGINAVPKREVNLLYVHQGGHGTRKTRNLVINFSRQGKHRELGTTQGKFGQHREFSKFP